MSGVLNAGIGRCHGTTRLLIKPALAVIELGASEDVLTKSLNAVHHANRHGSIDDFIAVAFPKLRKGRDLMMPGDEIELIGSNASLSALMELEGFTSLKRRGMLVDAGIEETVPGRGLFGAAYVRDRACEKHTPGWIRRSAARAERRGVPVGKAVKPRGNDLSALTLHYGAIVLHVREQLGESDGADLMVSTYGFSAPGAPAILPITPDSARVVRDAA